MEAYVMVIDESLPQDLAADSILASSNPPGRRCPPSSPFSSDLLFKFLCRLFQQLPDGQMLGAGLFALAAFDAGAGLAALLRVDLVIVIVRVPIVVYLLGVHNGKQVRDGNVLRTPFYAVPAGGTGNQVHGTEDLPHLADGLQLPVVQRLEVLHEADIFLHLLQAAHTGEDHHHPLKPAAKRIA